MTNELKNVPELRFPEFDGEWEENKINKFLKESIIVGSKGNKAKKLTVKLWGKGVVPKKEVHRGSNNTQYYIRKKGQLMYGKLDFLNCAFGIVPYELDGYESTIDSPAFDIIAGEPKFILEKIKQKSFYKKYGERANGSRKAKRINQNDFLDMTIYSPKYFEQKKIGEFFSKLDRQIELEEQKLAKLEEQKKGYMQNIFAQKLYFKDENGNKYPDWTIKKLNEVFEVSKQRNTNNEYSHKDVLSVSREHGVINQIKYHGRSYAAKTVENYKIVKPHDLIYTKSPLKGAPYGIFKVTTEEGIISPLYAVYTSLNENITDFVSYYFEFNNITTHYLSKLVSKGAKNTINVTDEMALTGKILLPNSEKEVTQIVNFFNEIRELIMKQRNKIEGLKMRKQGFLQKMFV